GAGGGVGATRAFDVAEGIQDQGGGGRVVERTEERERLAEEGMGFLVTALEEGQVGEARLGERGETARAQSLPDRKGCLILLAGWVLRSPVQRRVPREVQRRGGLLGIAELFADGEALRERCARSLQVPRIEIDHPQFEEPATRVQPAPRLPTHGQAL